MAEPLPIKQPARKRPELLLGALAMLGAAAALITLGVRGVFAKEPSPGEAVGPFDAPSATQSAAPAESTPAVPQLPETTASTQASRDAVGYTGIVVYYTDPAPVITHASSQMKTNALATAAQPTAAPQVPQPQYPVNLNTATQEQLETLPGIGPAKAQAILVWRITHGRFSSVAQLTQVSGIGEKTLQNLLPYVTV